ncbi:MAG: sulfite exporter TauE/SafE family protein [Firmicutes bacterium]|nr:sulfite exporter TauE/SafE family protein [Bacillota bacterium]
MAKTIAQNVENYQNSGVYVSNVPATVDRLVDSTSADMGKAWAGGGVASTDVGAGGASTGVDNDEGSVGGSSKLSTYTFILLAISGVLVGFVNGFFGGGGGLIAVPILASVLGLEAKKSHATAILVILPLSVASSVVYIANGAFNFYSSMPTIIGIIAGGLLGAYALSKLSNNVIRLVFAVVMVVAGAYMFLR